MRAAQLAKLLASCKHPKEELHRFRRPEARDPERPSLVHWCGLCGAIRYAGEREWSVPDLLADYVDLPDADESEDA